MEVLECIPRKYYIAELRAMTSLTMVSVVQASKAIQRIYDPSQYREEETSDCSLTHDAVWNTPDSR